ncbi:MAG: hypothetical protein CBB71_10630 [Rhodopirellula sp. TMED11]|nr:MAG: hypothetical protein CBB71_10630 [Rhodopirellula sp. TMED11]
MNAISHCLTSPAPRYVPAHVGRTQISYPPLDPRHFTCWHKGVYQNPNGGTARVTYYAPPIHTAIHNFYYNCLRLPR